MKKTYTIHATIEIKAKTLDQALKDLEPLTHRKKFRVVKLEYKGAEKK